MFGTIELRLPGIFWHDHTERDLPEQGESKLVREAGSTVVVVLDELALHDLWSDARHYADAGIAADMGDPRLAGSARRTLEVLEQKVPEIVARFDAERRAKGWS